MHGTIQGVGQLTGTLSAAGGMSAVMILPDIVPVPSYDGDYEFTPSQETQVVRIGGFQARTDITINPIPHNYGLVEWNGSYLRIS